MTTATCATARNIQCKHIEAEVYFWVNLSPMMLSTESIIGTPTVESDDPLLTFGAVTIISPEQIIYSDDECNIVLTTIEDLQGVYFLVGAGSEGLQTIRLTFEKSSGETDVINLLLRVAA